MKFIVSQILLLCLPCFVSSRNVEPPQETDVESPPYVPPPPDIVCETNAFGFAGIPLSDETNSTIRFNYAVKYSGSNIDDVLFETERRIANYLLAETSNFRGCGNRRRTQSIVKGGLRNIGHRKLQADAVAITVNPSDIDTGIPCEEVVSPPVEGQSCAIIDGAFTVFYEAGTANADQTSEKIESDVQEGMDLGKFDGGDISSVTWIDELESRSPGGNEINEGENVSVQPVNPDRNGSTPVIIGASVGCLLAIGLLAVYRRRSLKNNEDDILTEGPGGSTVGPGSTMA